MLGGLYFYKMRWVWAHTHTQVGLSHNKPGLRAIKTSIPGNWREGFGHSGFFGLQVRVCTWPFLWAGPDLWPPPRPGWSSCALLTSAERSCVQISSECLIPLQANLLRAPAGRAHLLREIHQPHLRALSPLEFSLKPAGWTCLFCSVKFRPIINQQIPELSTWGDTHTDTEVCNCYLCCWKLP